MSDKRRDKRLDLLGLSPAEFALFGAANQKVQPDAHVYLARVCVCCLRSRFEFWELASRHRCIDTTTASHRHTCFLRCRVCPPRPCPRTRSRHRQLHRRTQRQMHRPRYTACARRRPRRGNCWAASPPRTRLPLPTAAAASTPCAFTKWADLQALKRLGLTPAEFSVFGSSSGGKVGAGRRCRIDLS